MTGTTSVQVTREASDLLAEAAKSSGLAKSYLADVALKYFFDPQLNPGLQEALEDLASGRKLAEQGFVERILTRSRTNG